MDGCTIRLRARLGLGMLPHSTTDEVARFRRDVRASFPSEFRAGADDAGAVLGWLNERIDNLFESAPVESKAIALRETRSAVENVKISQEELQSSLFDVLGFDAFELIIEIIDKRKTLQCAWSTPPASINTEAMDDLRARGKKLADAAAAEPLGNVFKDGKRVTRHEDPRFARSKSKMPRGFKRAELALDKTGEMVDAAVGDEGEDSHITYEKITVPPPPTSDRNSRVLLETATLFTDDLTAAYAFKNTPTLNELQSHLFNAAYENSDNLLICAPTGAGKTNVALLTILRQLKLFPTTKIVYVAPMKALASEVVAKFSRRLRGFTVKELTGDTQLSRDEMEATTVVVTTPEKWDVVTRKRSEHFADRVALMIVDEVHLIGEDRGPVIEVLMARTLRLIQTKQKKVRVVGLSATLPNYRDVALFLKVDFNRGLYYFDNSYRPVPLKQTFIGVRARNRKEKDLAYDSLAYYCVLENILKNEQVMIFVHSRKDTYKTAKAVLGRFLATEQEHLITVTPDNKLDVAAGKSSNSELRELFRYGFGMHHAGMSRPDRNLVEEAFSKGRLRVLACTATLAWGVNLPAHAVILKGTQIYVPEKGGLTELSMQDVFQCFGRAGRPQFDTHGEAFLITEHAVLQRYVGMLNSALPLESSLIKALPDSLNAEIVSGTVRSVQDAVEWIASTFLYVRMLRNPTAYGISLVEKDADISLSSKRRELVADALKTLDLAQMAKRSDVKLSTLEIGRIASHYYVHHATQELFNAFLLLDNANKSEHSLEERVLQLITKCSEFSSLKVRDDETSELKRLASEAPLGILDDIDSSYGKTSILFQAHISRRKFKTFTLSSDASYIAQNVARLFRAFFESALYFGNYKCSVVGLSFCNAVERRVWWHPLQSPLAQLAVSLDVQACVIQNVFDLPLRVDDWTEEEVSILRDKLGAENYKKFRKKVKAQSPGLDVALVGVRPTCPGVLELSLRLEFSSHTRANYWVFVIRKGAIFHKAKLYRDSEVLEVQVPTGISDLTTPFELLFACDGWLGCDVALSAEIPTDLGDWQCAGSGEDAAGESDSETSYVYDDGSVLSSMNALQRYAVAATDKRVVAFAPSGMGRLIACALWLYKHDDARRVLVSHCPRRARAAKIAFPSLEVVTSVEFFRNFVVKKNRNKMAVAIERLELVASDDLFLDPVVSWVVARENCEFFGVCSVLKDTCDVIKWTRATRHQTFASQVQEPRVKLQTFYGASNSAILSNMDKSICDALDSLNFSKAWVRCPNRRVAEATATEIATWRATQGLRFLRQARDDQISEFGVACVVGTMHCTSNDITAYNLDVIVSTEEDFHIAFPIDKTSSDGGESVDVVMLKGTQNVSGNDAHPDALRMLLGRGRRERFAFVEHQRKAFLSHVLGDVSYTVESKIATSLEDSFRVGDATLGLRDARIARNPSYYATLCEFELSPREGALLTLVPEATYGQASKLLRVGAGKSAADLLKALCDVLEGNNKRVTDDEHSLFQNIQARRPQRSGRLFRLERVARGACVVLSERAQGLLRDQATQLLNTHFNHS